MIIPSIGRVVWYRGMPRREQPFAALVTYVHNDRMVNLVVFDHNGTPAGRNNVTLVQERDAIPAAPASYAEWMPYQVGQAKKTEQLAEQLKGVA